MYHTHIFSLVRDAGWEPAQHHECLQVPHWNIIPVLAFANLDAETRANSLQKSHAQHKKAMIE